LMAMFHSLRSEGRFSDQRGTNLLDSGAFFYDVYRTRDDKWVSIGAIETQFWDELCDALNLPADMREQHFDSSRWDDFRKVLATGSPSSIAPSSTSCSATATPATRPSSRSKRPRTTPTTRPGGPSSRS